MPKITLTAAERKAGVDLRDVLRGIVPSVPKKLTARPKRKKPLAPAKLKARKLPPAHPNAKRIGELKRARAIIAVASLSSWRNSFGHYDAPNYYKIATTIGLTKKDADLADEMWNDANGADEGPETEEHAMERVNDLLEMEKDA
jgi:hypothetical protein